METKNNAPYEAKLERTALALERIAIALEKLVEVKASGGGYNRGNGNGNAKGGNAGAGSCESIEAKFEVVEIGQTWKSGGGYFVKGHEIDGDRKFFIGVKQSVNLQVGDVIDARLEKRGKDNNAVFFIAQVYSCVPAPTKTEQDAGAGARKPQQQEEIEEDVPF